MSDLDDYTDLGEWEPEYECRVCGHLSDTKFDWGECPECCEGELSPVGAGASERHPVDHNEGFTGYSNRTVKL